MMPVTVQGAKMALFLFPEKQQTLLFSLNASLHVYYTPTFLSTQVSHTKSLS